MIFENNIERIAIYFLLAAILYYVSNFDFFWFSVSTILGLFLGMNFGSAFYDWIVDKRRKKKDSGVI